MKFLRFALLGSLTAAVLGTVFIFRGNFVFAQSYTPPTIPPFTLVPPVSTDVKINTFGQQGCIWSDDIEAGTVVLHPAEPQAPEVFYKEGTAPKDPCDYYSAPDWKNLNDVGEAALWPLGCFNPLNFYDFTTWIGAYGSFQFNKNYDSWDGFYYAVTGASNKRKPSPTVSISFDNTAPKKGDTVNSVASVTSYTALINTLLFGWSSQKQGQDFISQQGLVAGGKEIIDVKDILDSSGKPINIPACRRVTRIPSHEGDTDTNGDGMGDDWERQYFNTLNVKPGEDTDEDGIVITDSNVLDTTNPPRLVPRDEKSTYRVPAPDEDAYLGIRVTPDTTAGTVAGEGKFTNKEEYIWGTNPLDPDSDDDGFPDGADILGVGQESFKAVTTIDSTSKTNNRENIQVAVVGTTTFLDETNSGHKKIMIASSTKQLVAGNGDNLQASLLSGNDAPSAGPVSGGSQIDDQHRIVVEAQTTGSDADRAALEYTWFVEFKDSASSAISARVTVPSTPEYSLDDVATSEGRLGKYIFKHPITELIKYVPNGFHFTTGPGSLIYVTVDIANTVRKETTTKRIPIYLGTDSALELDISNLDTGETQTIEEYAKNYCTALSAQTFAVPLFCKQRTFGLNDVLPWLVFQGSKVVIKAAPPQTDTDGLTYRWFVNDVQVIEGYGTESQDNLLTLYPDAHQRIYNIRVEGYTKDRTRARVFTAQVEMQVVGPQATLTYTPVTAQVGTPFQLTGLLLNFPEKFVGSYTWTITKPDNTQISGTGKSYSFTPGSEGSYNVDLAIAFQSGQNSQVTLHVAKNFLVGSPSSLSARVGLYIASARTAFAQNAQTVYRFSLLAFGVIVVVLTTIALIRKKKK